MSAIDLILRYGRQGVPPTFQRDFAGVKTLDHGTGPAISFTRASGATFFDADGVLQTAANNAPRFDHDPANGASRGLLIEEQRTNHMRRSAEFFNNSFWGKVRSSITDDTIAAPDGTNTADTFVEDSTASNTHHVAQAVVGLSAAQALTGSVFAKAKERDRLRVQMWNITTGTNGVHATFNLSDGTVSEVTNQGTGTGAAASIVYVGNGWYRCSVSGTPATSDDAALVLLLNNGTSNVYTGDGTSGLYIWGAQLEVGAFPTSYIPTTTAAATRAADSAVVTPISSFYNQSEGTAFVHYNVYATSGSNIAFQLDNNSSSTFRIRTAFANNDIAAVVRDNDVVQSYVVVGTASGSNGINQSVAAAIKLNDFAASRNGASVVTDTDSTLPSFTHMRIGSTSEIGMHIRKLAYWPKRLTNTLLEQLTT